MVTFSKIAPKLELAAILARYFPGSLRNRHDGRACYGTRVRGATLVVEFMKFVGAEVVSGIPGGNSLPLNDALTHGHVDGAFRYILTGHEQGAAFEAEGFAAASGRVGFCTATSGPGATNLITGLADAFRDSRPVLAFTGNAATTAETESFQAIDIVDITDGKATKASFRIATVESVQDTLVEAYHLAITGRPGSVLVDLPKDVQTAHVTMRSWEECVEARDWSVLNGCEADIDAAARLLTHAERPLLYVGHGSVIAGATNLIRKLSHDYQIPVVTTVHALGTLSSDDALNLGMIGMHGTVVSNVAAFRSDVVLALGARFDDRVVGAQPTLFAPNARIIHVDVESSQLNRVREVSIAIHGDVSAVLNRLVDRLDAESRLDVPVSRQNWRDELATIQSAMPLATNDRPDVGTLSHEVVYETIAAILDQRQVEDFVATFDVGTHQMKGAQWFPVSQPRSWITSGGMGSMGCAIPLAVGASFARSDAVVLAMVGDGGFVMSSHELDTIGGYGIPVKIVLFDDAHLGMVTTWHSLFFEGRKLTSDRRRSRHREPVRVLDLKSQLSEALTIAASRDELADVLSEATRRLADEEWPAFAVLAASYGISSERIHEKAQLAPSIRRMLDTP
ncbi:MAG TPA: thiamine pyrophosphate-dependent enzyme, partial [Chloroflexota bacterium]|nr:thiamine pyrophosphate-dependent enzyme [Chloroflexota bacterium]